MGLDRANSSFLALTALVALRYLTLVVVGCGLLTVVGLRVADHGLAFATAGPGNLRPGLAALALVGVDLARPTRSGPRPRTPPRPQPRPPQGRAARVFSSAYFFLPALRGLRDRYGAASELAADRRAGGSSVTSDIRLLDTTFG